MSAIDKLQARLDEIVFQEAAIQQQRNELEEQIEELDRALANMVERREDIAFAIRAIEEDASEADVVLPNPVARATTVAKLAETPTKERAPRRDVRGMVLDAVSAQRRTTISDIAEMCDIRERQAEAAVDYWCAKGEISRHGSLVYQVAEETPAEPADEQKPEPATVDTLEQMAPPAASAAPQSERQKLIAFLTARPGAYMAEIMSNGIPAVEVYRAQREGVITEVDRGAYSLASEDAAAQ